MKIHFIGIGGIGVSALANYYLKKGHSISGSDLVSSEITEDLEKLGAKIYIGPHKKECLTSEVEQVIYSQAILEENPELKKAEEMGIRCLSYPQALGELTKEYFTIAVAGAHGKGTTTALISLILIKAGLDPTVIIGTKLQEFGGSNCRVGKSKYLVIEADEYREVFLNYWPKIIVLTNIDREHLDYYRDLEHIIESFGKFVKHLPKDGVLIANRDDSQISNLKSQISKPQLKTKNYSLNQLEAQKIKGILKIPGEHNVSNALAALSVARTLKIPDEISFEALGEYKGAWRRFEIKQSTINPKNASGDGAGNQQLTIISDYAHHPTEIEATLKAVKEEFLYPPKFSGRKLRRARKEIWCVFQPHQYQRTYYLFDEFVRVFKEATIEKVIITDIYQVAGREDEEIKEKVSSRKLVRAVDKPSVLYLPKEKITDYLKKNLKEGQVLIIMGAGDIYKLIQSFPLALQNLTE